jgi:hypothetical protein
MKSSVSEMDTIRMKNNKFMKTKNLLFNILPVFGDHM